MRFISDGTETAGDGVGYFGDVWSVDDDAGSVCTVCDGIWAATEVLRPSADRIWTVLMMSDLFFFIFFFFLMIWVVLVKMM